MGRAAAVAVLVLVALGAQGGAPAGAAEKPLLLKPAIPPDLQALEAKADALQITSQKVSVTTSLRLQHETKAERQFAALLQFSLEGVETTSPPAAALTMTLLGAHLRLRWVGGHVYFFDWALGRHDGGRPWVELGHGPLGRLFGGAGKKQGVSGVSGAARYGKLFTVLNDATGLHELAPTTLYGQPVTGFEAEVEPKAAGEAGGQGGSVGAFSAARRPAPAAPRPKSTLSVYFAASGAIVREQLAAGDARARFTITTDVPALDFPYTIPPPPPSHVITEAALAKRFGPHGRGHRVTARGKSKQ